MNKIGAHALCWVGGWSEAEARKAISGTAALGYDLIEIAALDPDRIDVPMTVRLLEEHGLGATMSLGLAPEMDISGPDPDAARRGEEFLMKVVSICRDLGGTHLCGIIYSAFMKYAVPANKAGVAQSAGILRRVAEAAAASDITLGMEVVNRYETNVLNTAAQGVAFCKMIGAPNVKVHLDTYHMNIEEADAESAIIDTGDYLGYFHVGESHRGYLGSGSIDFDAMFRGLARANYTGKITFESFSSKVVDPKLSSILGIWRNLWTDGTDLCREAKAFMDAHLAAAAATQRLAAANNPGVLQDA